MNRYLNFAQESIETLIEKQAAPWGGSAEGPLCLTITCRTNNSYRSVGAKQGDSYISFWFPAAPFEMEPKRLDLGLWDILDRLALATGEQRYTTMVDAMVKAFVSCGFEPISGLGYLGQEAQFDVETLLPCPIGSYPKPKFKPQADLPLERLWAAAPTSVARMFKAAYRGMITRPETMDFNRWCLYGFDDSQAQPAMEFNPGHIGFAQTGAALIHYWGFHYARTGDSNTLDWAQRMADKWSAVQHPETGLLPYFFGSGEPGTQEMPPAAQCHITDTMTALSLLRARDELMKRPASQPLAKQVEAMATQLLQGIANFGYDDTRGIFPSWMALDTGAYDYTAIWYTFPTQELKDEAVLRDPVLQEVEVFVGPGFYSDGKWSFGVDNIVPHDIALGALWTGDAVLRERAEFLAARAMEAARQLKSGFNERGQWTCSASASYIRMMLALLDLTGDEKYLENAQFLADQEMEFLARPLPAGQIEWWRHTFRNNIIDAMLELGIAVAERASADSEANLSTQAVST
jgi:hypothetical protein